MSTRQVLYIALLGLGLWGCRTPRGMLQAKEGQAPITPHPLSEIQVIDHIAVRDRDGMASWEEDGHTYEADMGWVTRLSITDHLPTLSGVETLRYLDGDHCARPPLHCTYLLASKIGIFRLRSGMAVSPPCPLSEGSSSREGAFLGYLALWSTRSPGIRFRLYAIASKIFCVCVRSSPR